jgi:hypothetical protein
MAYVAFKITMPRRGAGALFNQLTNKPNYENYYVLLTKRIEFLLSMSTKILLSF